LTKSTISGVFALLLVFGCAAETEVAPAESSSPAADSPSQPTAASAGDSAEEFLPEPADDGGLPRTLKGYTLLDSAPAESTHESGFPFQGSVSRAEIVRAKPRAEIRPYSLDGTIFRIVYSDDASPAMEDLVRVGLERYGKPFQQQEKEVVWIRGGRTLTLTHYPRTGGSSVAIEDEKGTLKAYRHARQLERSK
jgi:hypothetical protein